MIKGNKKVYFGLIIFALVISVLNLILALTIKEYQIGFGFIGAFCAGMFAGLCMNREL